MIKTRQDDTLAPSYRTQPIEVPTTGPRTPRAVLTTATPVKKYSYEIGAWVYEILLPSEVFWDRDQMPLLDCHDRWSVEKQLGSVRELSKDESGAYGALHFARDALSQNALHKVLDKHITDVSIGYFVMGYQVIKSNETAEVSGISFTATEIPLLVSTKTRIFETSITPIGADISASIYY